jgi:hypothetical protein
MSMELADEGRIAETQTHATRSAVGRRTVLAVGLAAAWSIPQIQLATALPSVVGSTVPPPSFLTLTCLAGSYSCQCNGSTILNVAGWVKNDTARGGNGNHGKDAAAVTLILVLPKSVSKQIPTILRTGNTWATVGTPTETDDGDYMYTFVAAIAPGDKVSLVGIELKFRHSSGKSFILTATVSVDGFVSEPSTVRVPGRNN